MTERGTRNRQRQQQEKPSLRTERGNTTISDVVVSQVAGIAAQEVDGVQMGGGTADAVRGFWDSVTGGSGQARGVTVEVGQVDTPRRRSTPCLQGGPAARNARLDQDDELADCLCKVQAEVVEEAGRLLAQRTAE